MSNWDVISDLYRKYFQSRAAKKGDVSMDEMLEGIEALRSTVIVWHNGKTLPAAPTVMRSIMSTMKGKFAPNLSMILQTHHEEPPMTGARTRECYNRVQAEWAECYGNKPIWSAMQIKDESVFLKCIEAYFVLGVMTGNIPRDV